MRVFDQPFAPMKEASSPLSIAILMTSSLAFAEEMVTDHSSVNKQAKDLAGKLILSPTKQRHEQEPHERRKRTH